MSTVQKRIAELAERNPEWRLSTLNQYLTVDLLKQAYIELNKHSATGIDGISVDEYGDNIDDKLKELVCKAKTGQYRAPPVKRVYIPKSKTEKRPLGIPTTEDKILQKGVQMLLEPIYETTFYDCSYGFRPGRSAHQALEKVWQTAMEMGGCWILDIDIKKYFNTIDHCHLREFLKQRVNDGVINRLIGKWLKAGVMENGTIEKSILGTPQGGIISPLISNVFLHYVLDEWFEKTVKPCLSGKAELVRFADDFVILIKDDNDARRVMNVLPKRLGKYGLEINQEKSRIVDFRRPAKEGKSKSSFNFLGFKHFWGKSRKGNDTIIRKTSTKSFSKGIKSVFDWVKLNRHKPVTEQHKTLIARVRGHYNYFGITGNSRKIGAFKVIVQNIWHYWLNRRGSKRPILWGSFNQFLLKYPLPEVKIYHSYI